MVALSDGHGYGGHQKPTSITAAPEDLGNDEVAKQAKYYLQPSVAKYRQVLRASGFEETTEMNDDYAAATFAEPVDFQEPDEVSGSFGGAGRSSANRDAT